MPLRAWCLLVESFYRGATWFGVCVGGGIGLCFGLLLHTVLASQPMLAHQILGHVMLGKLPTLLVAIYLLLRISFLMQTDGVDAVQAQTSAWHPFAHSGACVTAACVAWAMFMVWVIAGYVLGLAWGFPGQVQALVDAWIDDTDLWLVLRSWMRMVGLGWVLALSTAIEARWLMAPDQDRSLAMMRSMLWGAVCIAAVEALDVYIFW